MSEDYFIKQGEGVQKYNVLYLNVAVTHTPCDGVWEFAKERQPNSIADLY